MVMSAKQVIVMKKFPKSRNMRTGKYVAQGAHAAMGSLFSVGAISGDNFVIPLSNPFVKEWVLGNFKKVAVYVETDQELIDIYTKAKNANIACALIRDSGLTEFDGVPTLTAVGIGPDNEEEINKLTGHLPLF
jgi:PTH2 family peptidyl-tRNA hydrolase